MYIILLFNISEAFLNVIFQVHNNIGNTVPLNKTLQVHVLYQLFISSFIGLYNTIKIIIIIWSMENILRNTLLEVHSQLGNYYAITVLISAILMEAYNCKYNVCPVQTLDKHYKVPTDD